MLISASASQPYWLSANPTKPTASAQQSLLQQMASTKQNTATESGATLPSGPAILAAQEVENAEPAGKAWLDSVIASYEAEQAARSAAAKNRVIERIDVEKLQAQGNIIDIWNPTLGEPPALIPDTIDGVETGFLNSRHITLALLSKAEDLVENHPDLAQQLFNLDDPMHRSVLYYIHHNDYEPQMEPTAHLDDTSKHFYEAGRAMGAAAALGGLGSKMMFSIDAEVTHFKVNPFVTHTEDAVDSVHDAINHIAQGESRASALQKRIASNTDTYASQQLETQLQDVQTDVLNARNALREHLQDYRNLENFVSFDIMQEAFNQIYTERYGEEISLAALNEQYGISGANQPKRTEPTGFDKLVAHIMEAQAPIREKYGV